MEKAGFYHNLCNNVRYLRQQHGLTQKEMAAVLGVSVRLLRGIEHGEPGHRLGTFMLCRLCAHFGLSTDAVLCTRLEEMGIQDGDTVDIYDLEFEYQR